MPPETAGSANPADPPDTAALTWDEIIDHCSRPHTTRLIETPWDEVREGSRMLNVYIDGLPAVVVPTRMHEPGFYVRSTDGAEPYWNRRSPDDLRDFRAEVEAGRVTRR